MSVITATPASARDQTSCFGGFGALVESLFGNALDRRLGRQFDACDGGACGGGACASRAFMTFSFEMGTTRSVRQARQAGIDRESGVLCRRWPDAMHAVRGSGAFFLIASSRRVAICRRLQRTPDSGSNRALPAPPDSSRHGGPRSKNMRPTGGVISPVTLRYMQ